MTSKRLHLVLIGAICLLMVGLVGGAYGVNSLLTTRSNKLVGLKAQSGALDEEQLSLNKAKEEIKKYAQLEQIAKSVVPEDKDQAEAIREIVNIASNNGVSLASVTFPASTLGGNKTLATTPGAAATSTPSSASPAGTAGSGALSQLTPVKNIPGVYSLPITVTSDASKPVPYSQFVNFLSDLEHNRRTAQVTSISLQPSKDNTSTLSFTLQLSEYIKP